MVNQETKANTRPHANSRLNPDVTIGSEITLRQRFGSGLSREKSGELSGGTQQFKLNLLECKVGV